MNVFLWELVISITYAVILTINQQSPMPLFMMTEFIIFT